MILGLEKLNKIDVIVYESEREIPHLLSEQLKEGIKSIPSPIMT